MIKTGNSYKHTYACITEYIFHYCVCKCSYHLGLVIVGRTQLLITLRIVRWGWAEREWSHAIKVNRNDRLLDMFQSRMHKK